MEGLRERKLAASRARVVDAAFDLFAERGFDAVTVAEVCAAADIAPRTFFRYFPTKDDLLAEPARVMADRMRTALREVPPELSDAAALRGAVLALGEAVVADAARTARLFRVVRSSAAARPHPFLRLTERERELAELLVARSGRSEVDWRTRLLVARATAAFRVWLDDLVDGAGGDPVQHLAEVLDLR
ncbi:transcriptional regulator, TetR family [Klenkia soli]|uniref:Transcriptional regulator, TetR family n=1 Tax=Klenkia soli TaxID=1052260 RepID=A0A1H0PDI8_9ACTN|nr:TetR family transcriptional regulator [Klenkia soli]SDP03152.1 transcriptional regulator, TetR family [Klenkia soli]